MANRKKIAEKIQVSISAMGNVHHTVFNTSGERVNKYAVGNAKNISRIKAVNSGLIALPSACKTPCTATLNPINIKLKLAIRTAFAHTSVSATELPPDSAKSPTGWL